MEIVKNEFLLLEEENNSLFITVFDIGFTLKQFEQIMLQFPRISVTKFALLKEALEKPEKKRIPIGEWKPIVVLTITKDKMSAKIRLNCTENELEDNKEMYLSRILETLYSNGVKEGIDDVALHHDLVPQKDMVIARGIEPQKGEDAKVSYYKLSERKPTIKEDGKANFFDMNFIDEVKKGEWLGEKIPPTDGIPGRTVTGEIIPPAKGKDKKLLYDRKKVGEYNEEGKIVLRALIDGVVTITNNKITVGDHLLIEGNVGVETGNIEFDGSVTINGIILDGFRVTAKKDLSILGEMGITGVESVTSLEGDIFIKGGVFGKGNTIINAKRNVFLKHANDCHVIAGEDIHIGFYSIGSVLKGRHIIADGKAGKLIGGMIEAKGKVVAAIIGNKMERKTIIHVEGFDRKKVQEELQEVLLEYKKAIIRMEELKKQLDVFDSFNEQLNDQQLKEYNEKTDDFELALVKVTIIDNQRKSLMNLLETKGEGQISIEEVAYPETMLKIKNIQKKLNNSAKGTFYSEQSSLRFE